jgi:hypothetical protein
MGAQPFFGAPDGRKSVAMLSQPARVAIQSPRPSPDGSRPLFGHVIEGKVVESVDRWPDRIPVGVLEHAAGLRRDDERMRCRTAGGAVLLRDR